MNNIISFPESRSVFDAARYLDDLSRRQEEAVLFVREEIGRLIMMPIRLTPGPDGLMFNFRHEWLPVLSSKHEIQLSAFAPNRKKRAYLKALVMGLDQAGLIREETTFERAPVEQRQCE